MRVVRVYLTMLLVGAAASAQEDWPRGFYNGGNLVVAETPLRVRTLEATVIDPSGDPLAIARVQIRLQGRSKIAFDFRADSRGRFRLPKLAPGRYWMGVSAPGFNLHYWPLEISDQAVHVKVRITLSLGV